MKHLLISILIAAVLAPAALAAPGDPKPRHTALGQATALSVLLKRSEIGQAWKATPAAKAGPSTACTGIRPNQSDLTETGYAQSADFSLGQSEQVSQSARVFATTAQASSSYSRTVTIALVDCLAKELEAASDKKSTVKVTGQYRLPFPKLTPNIAGFRVVAHAKTPDAKFDVYADILVMQRGSTVTTVTATGFGEPVAAPFEQGLARIVAKRLGAKVAGPTS
jgi:hypothetical protein